MFPTLLAGLVIACSGASVRDPQPRPSWGADPSGQTAQIRESAVSILGSDDDYQPLLSDIGEAQVVALGEATHGSHEFYRERARITEALVGQKGFGAVVIEGEWPDADRINRYVRGYGSDTSADQALADFKDFPRWMWRNAEFAQFAERLRTLNAARTPDQRVGIYGMDIYNPFGAADAVLSYLGRTNPTAAVQARTSYRCFLRYRPNAERYALLAGTRSAACAEQVRAVHDRLLQTPPPADAEGRERHFSATLSASVVTAAEEYHRADAAGSNSWNVRDRGMVRNIEATARHTAAMARRPGKVVVWAHNSHVGDARATDASTRGDVTIGQLLRERMGDRAYLVGFLTYAGEVLAASEWGEPGRRQTLREALPGSHGELLHSARLTSAYLLLPQSETFAGVMMQRAVGVIYLPATERVSHYMQADLNRQFDAAVFIDQTTAVTPR